MIEVHNERDEILPGLWVGQLPRNIDDFKYVICVAERPSYHISIGQMVVCRPFNDSPVVPPDAMLHELAEMALMFRSRGHTLVHCTAGVNRSPLIVGLALIKSGMSAAKAIDFLREQRPGVLQNRAFEDWLRQQTPPDYCI